MRQTIFHTFLLLVILASSHGTRAQIDTSFSKININYPDYLSLVGKNNLNYIAQQFNLSIAEAGIEMAKVLPDPQVMLGYFNNGQQRMKTGYGFNVNMGYTIELGGKRRSRINLASSQLEFTKALLNDYFRNLRADATLGYLLAMSQRNAFGVQLSSYTSMKKLADADSVRFRLGSIMEIDARQSKLEAAKMLNNLYQGEADWKGGLIQLGILLGRQKADTLYNPLGDFSKFDRSFDLNQLITTAQNNRADLVAALRNKNVSENMLRLARANRMVDLGVNFGVNSNAYILNKIEPTPSYNTLAGGLTLPLKFSNNYRGDLKAAEFAMQQADAQYRQVELQILVEITKAYYNYLAAKKQVQQFNAGLLSEAKKVLDGKIYSYQRGETSLLELLNAQRTYNEVQLNYYDTLYGYAAALVELERAAGIWDINF